MRLLGTYNSQIEFWHNSENYILLLKDNWVAKRNNQNIRSM